MRSVAPDDHRELAPRDPVVDVQPPELAGDRGVLLRDVPGAPGLGRGGLGAMPRFEQDRRGARIALGEPAEGLVGRALEREQVRLEIAGRDKGPRADLRNEAFGREGRVLVVVDHHVIERRVARPRPHRGLLDEAGEVDLARGVEHREVVAEERPKLVPPRQPTFGRPPFDVLRRTQRLLRPDHQLSDLVGEPAELQERAEDRPALGILAVEKLANPGELFGRRQHRGRRVVTEPFEPLADDVERQAVDRDDGEARQGDRETFEEQPAGLVPRAPRTHDERHALGVRTALDEPGEPLAKDRRLAGARTARDEHRAVGMVEDLELAGIGFDGGHRRDGTAVLGHGRPVGVISRRARPIGRGRSH